VKLKPGTAVDASSLEALITVACVEIRRRLGPPRAAFTADAEFDGITRYCQASPTRRVTSSAMFVADTCWSGR
jgi:hypothetical protein